MKDKLISIIIPIYNVENYLQECLNSVYKIDHPRIEVILVDDGSTDNSAEIANEYAQQHASNSILVSKVNGGLSSARNAGLKVATGEWIAFLDSDDYIDPEQYNLVLKKIPNITSDIIAFDGFQYFDNTGETKNLYAQANPFEDGSELDAVHYLTSFLNVGMTNIVTVWDKIYRKSTLDQFNSTFIDGIIHEDIPFTLGLYVKGVSITFLNNKVIYYRQREGSIMSTPSPKKLNSKVIAINSVIDQHKQCAVNNKFINDYLVFMVSYLIKQGGHIPYSLLFKLFGRKLSLKKRLVLFIAMFNNLFNKKSIA